VHRLSGSIPSPGEVDGCSRSQGTRSCDDFQVPAVVGAGCGPCLLLLQALVADEGTRYLWQLTMTRAGIATLGILSCIPPPRHRSPKTSRPFKYFETVSYTHQSLLSRIPHLGNHHLSPTPVSTHRVLSWSLMHVHRATQKKSLTHSQLKPNEVTLCLLLQL
jgi:hypothetical protein